MNRRLVPSRTLLIHLGVVLLGAAAAIDASTTVELAPTRPGQAAEDIQLQRAAQVRLGLGDSQELPAGSRWRAVGSLAQGTVYRPVNSIFSIEGRPIQAEAYVVVKGGVLQGLYLPARASYSPIRPALPLAVATLPAKVPPLAGSSGAASH